MDRIRVHCTPPSAFIQGSTGSLDDMFSAAHTHAVVAHTQGLLLSCEVQGTREDGAWVHFRFEGPLSKVLGHSCCDWCVTCVYTSQT